MFDSYKKRSKEHIFKLIALRNDLTPSFALLIGAGASVNSGVKAASVMIDEWRQQLYANSKSNETFEKWLEDQPWHGDDDEYGLLFEKVCDQPSQRRIYVEECIKNAKPSWGYVYLSNLIKNNYFNIIFTPNFDDLLNEACFLYAGCKPIVCAHDSAVIGIRITSSRPKIIKLHGDFLYDTIKNTLRETDSLEKNMQAKLMQFSREYGLIVIGYSGNDQSIMNTLDSMMKPSETEQYFPNGIYWCTRKGSKISKKLDRLLQREKVYLVEIEGFDEFMAELHQFLGLALPDFVRDPYHSTTEKLNTFVSNKTNHYIITQHINALNEQIKKFEQEITGHGPKTELSHLIPYRLLVSNAMDSNRYEEVIKYAQKAMDQNPDADLLFYSIAKSYIALEKYDDASKISDVMMKKWPTGFYTYLIRARMLAYCGNISEAVNFLKQGVSQPNLQLELRGSLYISLSNYLLIVGDWQNALQNAEKALQIDPQDSNAIGNKCIALKSTNQFTVAKQIIIEQLLKVNDDYTTACFYAILEDKSKMIEKLATAIHNDKYNRIQAKFDPDFKAFINDPDFRKLVYLE